MLYRMELKVNNYLQLLFPAPTPPVAATVIAAMSTRDDIPRSRSQRR